MSVRHVESVFYAAFLRRVEMLGVYLSIVLLVLSATTSCSAGIGDRDTQMSWAFRNPSRLAAPVGRNSNIVHQKPVRAQALIHAGKQVPYIIGKQHGHATNRSGASVIAGTSARLDSSCLHASREFLAGDSATNGCRAGPFLFIFAGATGVVILCLLGIVLLVSQQNYSQSLDSIPPSPNPLSAFKGVIEAAPGKILKHKNVESVRSVLDFGIV